MSGRFTHTEIRDQWVNSSTCLGAGQAIGVPRQRLHQGVNCIQTFSAAVTTLRAGKVAPPHDPNVFSPLWFQPLRYREGPEQTSGGASVAGDSGGSHESRLSAAESFNAR